jgi:hypothetical protein
MQLTTISKIQNTSQIWIIPFLSMHYSILAVGKFPNTVSGLMKCVLVTVETRCNEVGLTVNTDMNELVVFKRKRKLPGFFEPHFWRIILSLSRSVKYLGVIMEPRLIWREHVDVKMRKAYILLWTCRWACGARWGLRPKVVHWLYVAITQPSISYASLVWWPGCQTASAKKTLSRIQRCACLRITVAIRTTHAGAMEAFTGLPPLDLVIYCEARSVAHRLWRLGCWSYLHPNRGHSSIPTRLQKCDPIFNMAVDVIRPVFNLKPKYRVTMLTREEWTRGPGTLPSVKGLVWSQIDPGLRRGPGLGSLGNM